MPATTKPDVPKFSARDLEVAALVWQCFKNDPQVDYPKLALLANFKNDKSAAACWLPIKKRLMAAAGPTQGTDSAASGPTKKPASKKRKSDDQDGTTSAKSGKARKGNAGKTVMKEQDNVTIGVVDGGFVKVEEDAMMA